MKLSPRNRMLIRLISLWVLLAHALGLSGSSPVARAQTETSTSSLDLVLLIDSSTSMLDSDRAGLRVDAAVFLLEFIQEVAGVQGLSVRFAAANFGGESVTDAVALRPLQGDAAQNAIRLRADSESTLFAPALNFAIDQLQDTGDSQKVVILFTDGLPEGEAVTQAGAYFTTEMSPRLDSLQQSGAQVFVVALRNDKTVQVEDLWIQAISAARYRVIDQNTDLVGAFRDLFAGILGLRPGEAQTAAPGASQTIKLEPYLEQAVISVFKSGPSVSLRLIDPNQTEIPPTRRTDQHEIFALTAPQGGEWKLGATGGAATIWVDRRLPTLTLEGPTEPQALGQPLTFTGRLLRLNQSISKSSLELSLSIAGPENQLFPALVMDRFADRYSAEFTGALAEGVYTVTLSARSGGEPVLAESSALTVGVFLVPSIRGFEIAGDTVVGQTICVCISNFNGHEASQRIIG
ncbi:MAG: VWA domain-containing protein [Chloroflexi bacterium]|nr:VWA domain-containing protein [Chloroflexota bacterium]